MGSSSSIHRGDTSTLRGDTSAQDSSSESRVGECEALDAVLAVRVGGLLLALGGRAASEALALTRHGAMAAGKLRGQRLMRLCDDIALARQEWIEVKSQ